MTSSTGSRALTRSSPEPSRSTGGLLDVELVDDLADQLLDEVLERHQSGGAAVLVDHHRLVELVGLHLAHQVGHPLGLGDEVGRRGDASRTGVGPWPCPDGTDHVLGVGDAHHVVHLLLDRGHPAEPDLEGPLEGGLDRLVGADGDHVGPGHHHLPHHGVAELDDRVDEGALLGLDDLPLDGHVGHGQELGLGDVGARGTGPSRR